MRVVTLNSFLPGFRLVADWAERNAHELVLLVTPPITAARRYDEHGTPLILDVPATLDVLTTGRLRSVAAPVIASMEPDLVVSAAFPRLIPPEILRIPRYGAVNLHPSPLPAGRGPNPIRLVYEGAATVGATLHRTEAEFDDGAVLSRRERPLPADVTGASLFAAWQEMLAEVLEEGAARALAGEPGEPQDPAAASYAGAFTEAEHLLDLTEPAAVVRRRCAALNLLSPRARVLVGDLEETVHALDVVPGARRTVPGAVLAKHTDGWTVQTADEAVRIVTGG